MNYATFVLLTALLMYGIIYPVTYMVTVIWFTKTW